MDIHSHQEVRSFPVRATKLFVSLVDLRLCQVIYTCTSKPSMLTRYINIPIVINLSLTVSGDMNYLSDYLRKPRFYFLNSFLSYCLNLMNKNFTSFSFSENRFKKKKNNFSVIGT